MLGGVDSSAVSNEAHEQKASSAKIILMSKSLFILSYVHVQLRIIENDTSSS
jgi:hypothetical protein